MVKETMFCDRCRKEITDRRWWTRKLLATKKHIDLRMAYISKDHVCGSSSVTTIDLCEDCAKEFWRFMKDKEEADGDSN